MARTFAGASYMAGMALQIARLDSRALVRVSGPDARAFLHGLLTQDVETLTPGEVRYGALLSPPGRLLFDLFIVGQDEGAVLLDVAADRWDALVQRLSMYRLRAAVEIAVDDGAVWAAWGGEAQGFSPDPRLRTLGGRGYGGDHPATATEDDWRRHQMSQGAPDTADMGADRTYPIEANLDLLNGIDFHKGCFIGQETTSRMKRRGAIKNRMAPLTYDGPALTSGAEVLNGDRRAGEVMSTREGMAMALLRLDRLEGALTVDGRAVEVWLPDWMPLSSPA
jgi:folate-binding protein YgfZ